MNPGALGGATGTDQESLRALSDDNADRLARARRLIDAVLSCDQEDRIPFLETILDNLRPGWPMAYNIDLMEEAGWWADSSTRVERKAYLLACYRRLSGEDQAAFLGFVQGKAAA